MDSMSKVLFVVGGFGLGNSTRCDALIRKLQSQGIRVDVATSGNGSWYFSGNSFAGRIIELEKLGFSGTGGRVSLLRTFFRLPGLAQRLGLNALKLLRLQRENSYDFIATDSEYSIFLVRPLITCPIVAINNVFHTFADSAGFKTIGASLFNPMFFVECLDFFIQKYLSDFQIAPTLNSVESHANFTTLFCPPLVRDGFSRCQPPAELRKALVIASGSGLGISNETVDRLAACSSVERVFVVGLEGKSRDNIIYLGRHKDVATNMAEADFVVTNGGFSSLSEAVVSRRPLLVIPIAGHFEQSSNAKAVETAGFGVRSRNETLEEDVLRLRSLFESGRLRHATELEGSELAAEALMNLGVRSAFANGQARILEQ